MQHQRQGLQLPKHNTLTGGLARITDGAPVSSTRCEHERRAAGTQSFETPGTMKFSTLMANVNAEAQARRRGCSAGEGWPGTGSPSIGCVCARCNFWAKGVSQHKQQARISMGLLSFMRYVARLLTQPALPLQTHALCRRRRRPGAPQPSTGWNGRTAWMSRGWGCPCRKAGPLLS